MMFEYDGFLWTMNHRGKTEHITGEPISPSFITIDKHSLNDGQYISSSLPLAALSTESYPTANFSRKRTFCVLNSRPTIVEIQFSTYANGYIPRTITFLANGTETLNAIVLDTYMNGAVAFSYPSCTIYSLGIFGCLARIIDPQTGAILYQQIFSDVQAIAKAPLFETQTSVNIYSNLAGGALDNGAIIANGVSSFVAQSIKSSPNVNGEYTMAANATSIPVDLKYNGMAQTPIINNGFDQFGRQILRSLVTAGDQNSVMAIAFNTYALPGTVTIGGNLFQVFYIAASPVKAPIFAVGNYNYFIGTNYGNPSS